MAAAGLFALGIDALSWERATGYVIEVEGDQVVRFADVEETVWDVPPDVDNVSVDDVVTVWYPVDHPSDATLMSAWESFGIGVVMSAALGAFGLGMVIVHLFDLSPMSSAAERSDPVRQLPAPLSPPPGNAADQPAIRRRGA